jgi:polyhydroxyalkanoate synthase subunit PhaC
LQSTIFKNILPFCISYLNYTYIAALLQKVVFMRRGPYPLSAQIGLMASSLAQAEGVRARVLQDMLLGIQKYHIHPYERAVPPLHMVWQSGSVTVSSAHDGKRDPAKPVLLLVPSMINRAYIMDLMPERSLLRWLEARGVEAYLLDWGDPIKDGDFRFIDTVISEKLIPAIAVLSKETRQAVHALGYCMGGTLLAGAAQEAASYIKSLIFLAAPWDFHAGSRALLNRVQFYAPAAKLLMTEKGMLPMEWMQTVFASLDPASSAHKFAQFAAMNPESDETWMFVAVEDWLNDGVDLPATLARQAIDEWFLRNKPGTGEWIDIAKIKTPSLIVTSRKDRLVEYETAAALQAQIPDAALINCGCGHIGMIAGRHAVEKVWEPIAAWVKNHN